jgi:putative PIN family toxin of toxin-antitoxin system
MNLRPRWIADTNTLVSAFLWQGRPGQIIAHAGEKTIQLITSFVLLDELDAVLHSHKLSKAVARTGLTAKQIMTNYKRLAAIVAAPPLMRSICRDPDDDAVLACALAAKADLIVSGDKDLLVLDRLGDIPVLSIRQALATIG